MRHYYNCKTGQIFLKLTKQNPLMKVKVSPVVFLNQDRNKPGNNIQLKHKLHKQVITLKTESNR